MGAAIAKSLRQKVSEFTFYRGSAKDLKEAIGGRFANSPSEASQDQDVLFLCFKPYNLEKAAKEIAPYLNKKTVVISILAGVTIDTIKKCFPENTVFRIMPNLPIVISKGIVAICSEEKIRSTTKEEIDKLLHPLGTICHIKESKMDAFTALFSSGVAFVLSFLSSMEVAAEKLGFSAEMAEKLLHDLFTSSVELLHHEKSTAKSMINKVTSPKGTTLAGLDRMEQLHVHEGIVQGVLSAKDRSKELSGS